MTSRFARRIPRHELEATLDAFMARVREADQDDRFICRFDLIAVFGSYLQEQPDYGDLDIAFVQMAKPQFRCRPWPELEEYHLQWFPADRHYTWRHPVALSNKRLRMYVRARNKRISLHSFGELQEMRCPYRLLRAPQDASSELVC